MHPSKCINHTAYTHTNLIILLTNFKLVMSYPNYLNYPTFWLFGFWKLYDSVKHQSVFVLLAEYKSDKVFLHFWGKNKETPCPSHRFGCLTRHYFKQNWMNGSQSNIIQYTILELMATIVSFEWGILKKHVPPYLHIGSK